MRISNYPTDTITGTEMILASNFDTSTQKYATVNFTVDTLKTFFVGTEDTNEFTNIVLGGSLIFEGATADAYETTLGVIDPTADIAINLPNVAGTLPVLAVASTTQITSTPEELNKLDGYLGSLTELNYLKELYDTGVTAAEYDILDGVTSTAAEINLLDGSVAETVVNSKGVIYGAAGKIVANGVDVTGTSAQIRIATPTTATDASLFISGGASTTEGLKLWYDYSSGASYIDSVFNNADGDLYIRTKTAGTPVNAIVIESAGDATFVGAVDAVNYKINGSQGSDGQVLTSTGSGVAWEAAGGSGLPLTGGTLTGALTVGVDDTGYDVKFFGDTTLKSMLWDASEDSLIFPENTKVKFLENSGGDCSLYNTSNGNFYMSNTSGWTILACKDGNGALAILNVAGTASLAAFYVGGSCEFYEDNVKRIETTTGGMKVTGGIEMGLAVADPTRIDLQNAQAITHNDHKGTLLFDALDAGIADGALSAEITFNNTVIDAEANVIIQMKSNIVADVIVYNIADNSCKFKILNKSGGAIADGTDMDLVYTVINQN